MNTTDRIAKLEKAIARLRAEEANESLARRNQVKPLYRWTLTPTERKYDAIFDPDVSLYKLDGVIVNKDELSAAGWSDRDMFQGGMAYYFNHATGRIIAATGGGSVWVSDGGFKRDTPEIRRTFDELSTFIVTDPDGGDVTDIILAHRARTNKS